MLAETFDVLGCRLCIIGWKPLNLVEFLQVEFYGRARLVVIISGPLVSSAGTRGAGRMLSALCRGKSLRGRRRKI